MKTNYIQYEGVSLSFKKIFSSLFKYKFQNLFILTICLVLGFIYYYFSTPVYETYTTLEIKNVNNNRQDIFGNLVGVAQSIETEKDILSSRFLIEETIKHVNFEVSYFKKERLKTIELYSKTPFILNNVIIKDNKIYGKKFKIVKIDNDKFQLTFEKTFIEKLLNYIPFIDSKQDLQTLQSTNIYSFFKPIKTKEFSFTITDIDLLKDQPYFFRINSKRGVIEYIAKNLNVEPLSFQSSVLKISFRDTAIQRTTDFLNALTKSYLDYSIKNQTEEDSNTLHFINKQLEYISQKLQESSNKLQQFKKNNNLTDINLQTREIVENLSNFEAQYEQLKIEKSEFNTVYKDVLMGRYSTISSLGARYPILIDLVANLQNALSTKARLSANYTTNHPEIQLLNNDILSIKKSIRDIAKGIKDSINEREKSLKKVIKEYKQKLSNLPIQEKLLASYERIFLVNERIYNYLLERQSELSVAKASVVSNKKILDKAIDNDKPVQPKRSLIFALSFIIGLILVFIYSLIKSLLDTKIKDVDDILSYSSLPIYGVIPFIEDKTIYNAAYVLDKPNSTASEALRLIRTNLEYTPTETKSKVILVTSTVPNEGKTSFSANLAAILGMSEKSSIVVSLDLRRPELHHKFALTNKIGISDVLLNRKKLIDVTWEHEHLTNFNIITSGPIPSNPAELLNSKKMEQIINELRSKYDYIILDTPPIHYVTDALSLIKYADITLFVLKSGFSEIKYIKEIDALVKKLNIKNAGFVLTSVKSSNTKETFDKRYLHYEPL